MHSRETTPLSRGSGLRNRVVKDTRERAEGRCFFLSIDGAKGGRFLSPPTVQNPTILFSEKKKKLKTSRLRRLCSSLSSPLLRTHASLRTPSPLCCPCSSTSTSERETENPDPRKAAKRKTTDTDAIQTSRLVVKSIETLELPSSRLPFFRPSRSEVSKKDACPRAAEHPGREKRKRTQVVLCKAGFV